MNIPQNVLFAVSNLYKFESITPFHNAGQRILFHDNGTDKLHLLEDITLSRQLRLQLAKNGNFNPAVFLPSGRSFVISGWASICISRILEVVWIKFSLSRKNAGSIMHVHQTTPSYPCRASSLQSEHCLYAPRC